MPDDAASPAWRAQIVRFRSARFWKTRAWRVGRWPLAVAGALFTLSGGAFLVLYLTISLPKEPPAVSSSVIVDAKGRELAVLAKNGFRVNVKLSRVAPVVQDAVIASEDRRFYEHGGVDPLSTLRALLNDLRGGSIQGGSTLTQQLVKNSFLSNERSVTRKIKEAILAIKLDHQASKNEILERYLNTVYFGRGAYGIEAAAKVYFDSSASRLSTDQAALLVGLLSSPESAEPSRSPGAARMRRNAVLDKMVEAGRLSRADAEAAKTRPLGTVDPAQQVSLSGGVAAHFAEWVRQQAIAKFGEARVYGGGLTIHTTLDLDDQRAAEAAVASTLTEPTDPQAALVALDRDGAIKAYVGGRDFNTLKVDLARGKEGGGSGRQAGSTFKPFALAAALEKGTGLGTRFDGPRQLTLDTGWGPWTVENYNGESYGNIDLRDATAQSVNTVYAQLALATGPTAIVDAAHAAGITSPLQPNPSIVLGTEDVSPLEMSRAYLTLARDGERVEPFAITSVTERDGTEIFRAPVQVPQRDFDAGVAQAVNTALQDVVSRGTGTAAALDRPVAGKTGTTQNYGDAWFAGYTPNYVAVVWMGYPEGQQHQMDSVHGAAVTGGTLPAKIWKSFMGAALSDVPVARFAPAPALLLGNGASLAASLPSSSESLSGSLETVPSTTTVATAPSTTQPVVTTGPKPRPTTTTTTTTTTTATTAPPTTAPPTTVAGGATSTTTTPPT